MNLLNYYEQHDGFCANMLLIHGYTSKDKKKIMNDYSFLTDDEAGRKLVSCFTSSLVNAICSDRIKNNSHIKVEKLPFNQ